MKKRVIGAVTIGQSPRVDLVPELISILGPDIEIRERGALDGLTKDEIAALAPQLGDSVLVTRLADGSSARIAERHITPRLSETIHALFREGIDIVALLCTGEFPELEGEGLLIRPQVILYNVAQAVSSGLKLGVICPDAGQITEAEARWRNVGREQVVVVACPYGDPEEVEAGLEKAARTLKAQGVELAVLDCIGYTVAMQELVRKEAGVPVILARGILARVLKELIG
jgi:protein AroM